LYLILYCSYFCSRIFFSCRRLCSQISFFASSSRADFPVREDSEPQVFGPSCGIVFPPSSPSCRLEFLPSCLVLATAQQIYGQVPIFHLPQQVACLISCSSSTGIFFPGTRSKHQPEFVLPPSLSCLALGWPPSQIQISPPEVLRSARLFCSSRCLPRGEIVQLVSICVLAGHFAPLAELAPVFSTAVRFSVPAPRGSQPHFRSRQSFPVQPS
jgi:hypothetical protein